MYVLLYRQSKYFGVLSQILQLESPILLSQLENYSDSFYQYFHNNLQKDAELQIRSILSWINCTLNHKYPNKSALSSVLSLQGLNENQVLLGLILTKYIFWIVYITFLFKLIWFSHKSSSLIYQKNQAFIYYCYYYYYYFSQNQFLVFG